MAVDNNYAVGYENKLPWGRIEEDLQHFKMVTMNSIILMGRKTWESIGSKKLPGRINVVVSSKPVEGADWTVSGDIKDIFEMLNDQYPDLDVYLIGGAGLVEETVNKCLIDSIILTSIDLDCEADVHLNPSILNGFKVKYLENLKTNPNVSVLYYKRIQDKDEDETI